MALFISSDNARFIVTTEDGAPCLVRGKHKKLAREKGLELDSMENMTFDYCYVGKGTSIREFLEQ